MKYPVSVPNVALHGGKFSDGDPTAGIARSMIPSAWANLTTDELINIVVAGGLTPSEADATQVLTALHVLFTTPAQALLKASNLSDLTNPATARTNLGAAAANGLATLDGGGKVPVSQLPASILGAGAANGLATLDGGGKVPVSQLPASILGALIYQGTWNANTNSPALASGTGTKGFYYKVSTAGTSSLDGLNVWNVGDLVVFDGATWDKIDGTTDEVVTFNGRFGAVVLLLSDVITVLGFNPVQQGTGVGQTSNAMKIGWSAGGKPKLTVDTTDVGNIALESWVTGNFDAAGAAFAGQTAAQAFAVALLANTGFLLNVKPMTLTASFSDSISLTATAPHAGIYLAASTLNFSVVGAVGSSTTAALSISGASTQTESTQTTSVQFNGVAVSAGASVTASLAVTTGGTSPATIATARVMMIFIPTN
jgi:hypothetical protein